MTKPKAARASFSLRLQPYDGSLLAEVVHYLNSLDRAEAQRRVENVMVMALLAQARLYDEACSTEARRRCCIEACDALEKHASMLRQLVGVEAAPVVRTVAISDSGGASQQVMRESLDGDEQENDELASDSAEVVPPKAKLSAIASAQDVDALFGG